MCRRTVLPALVALGVWATFAAPARADIDSGLVAYWPLDGDAADATGDGNAGSIKGNVTPAVSKFGGRDRAMYFSGEPNAYIDLHGQRGLLPRHALTVAAWVRADNVDQSGRIITMQDDQYYPRSCSLQLLPGRVTRFEIGQEQIFPDTPVVTAADSHWLRPPRDQWIHVAGVFRPGEALELWINGHLSARQPVTETSLFGTSSGSIVIGGPGRLWQGCIDEVRLYARALAAADVNELYMYAPAPYLKAWQPQPADGAIGVTSGPFTWKRGALGVSGNLYFGTTPTLGPKDLVGRFAFPAWTDWPLLAPGAVYYWRVDQVEADGWPIYQGDTWHFTAKPDTPFNPWPADGANSVSMEMYLRWSPVYTRSSYRVYFGADPAALSKIESHIYTCDPDRTRFDPGALEAGVRYYWRVEEVSMPDSLGHTRTFVGPVWSFTTADWPVVEDFENYGPDDSYCNHVHDVWLRLVPNVICDPGPCLYPPYIEHTIVQSGRQAMVFDYNNAVAPWLSEVQRTFTAPRNWTIDGTDTLVVHVRGLATNDPGPFYLVIQDSAGRVAFATHPDPQVLLATKWVEWRIPLSSLTGVNLARVKKVYLGVGDPRTPTPGGLGWVYIDDIRVIKASS